VYEYRKKIAVFLVTLMFMTVLTTQYSKTQVNAAAETVVSQFAIDAVAKLLVAVSGAYLVNKINEEYDMDLDTNDVVQTVDSVKTLYHIFLTNDGFKLEDKTTGEEISIKTDTSSVASHLITQTTPSDSHAREFYNWYMSNVSKKLGQYHIRVREWSDTYSQYIDRYYAADNPVQLYKYVPKQYQDDFMQLFADMQNMVKNGFLTNGAEKGFLELSTSVLTADFFNIETGEPYTILPDNKYMIPAILEIYNEKILDGYPYVALTASLSQHSYKLIFSDYITTSTYRGGTLVNGLVCGVYVFQDGKVYKSYYPDYKTYGEGYDFILSNVVLDGAYGNTTGSVSFDKNSPVTIPLFPPVQGDAGNLVLDHGDVQDVPVQEDQDGVPFVPPTWWDEFFRRYFGDLVPADGTYDGSLTDMTERELLQEITNNTKRPNFTIVDGTAILELLKDKFGLFYQLYEFFKGILQADYSPQRPEFNVTFNGQLGIHGTYNILNLDWYDDNRNYIMLFITSTTWFFTGLKLFRRLPKAIET